MFLAEINNYDDDLLDSLDEISVMLDEMSEMLEEGNVEGFGKWFRRVRDKVSRFLRGLSSAARGAYNVVKKGIHYAIEFCKKNKDLCEELKKKALN